MKKNNLVLIGMMGAGKSTIALELSKMLKNYTLVDMDSEIEKRENKKISDIFEKYGEKYFRNLETKLLIELSNKDYQIISTGGGIFEKEENRKILNQNGIVFYLKASGEKLFERIKSQTHRPLLRQGFGIENIKNILNTREVNYQKADITINTEDKTPIEIAKQIIVEKDKINE